MATGAGGEVLSFIIYFQQKSYFQDEKKPQKLNIWVRLYTYNSYVANKSSQPK